MLSTFRTLLQRLLGAAALACVAAGAQAQTVQPDPNSSPDQLVLAVADQTLAALKAGNQGDDIARVNKVVNQYVLPYVDLQKTTRLATGRYWRDATEAQRTALTQAFRGSLVRTYSGALAHVDSSTTIKLLPRRSNDVQGDDAMVRSSISASNSQPVEVDYRLGKDAQGWRIYDLNVEGVWLIQNYRNQFAQQIDRNGIDGLIKALDELDQRNGGN